MKKLCENCLQSIEKHNFLGQCLYRITTCGQIEKIPDHEIIFASNYFKSNKEEVSK